MGASDADRVGRPATLDGRAAAPVGHERTVAEDALEREQAGLDGARVAEAEKAVGDVRGSRGGGAPSRPRRRNPLEGARLRRPGPAERRPAEPGTAEVLGGPHRVRLAALLDPLRPADRLDLGDAYRERLGVERAEREQRIDGRDPERRSGDGLVRRRDAVGAEDGGPRRRLLRKRRSRDGRRGRVEVGRRGDVVACDVAVELGEPEVGFAADGLAGETHVVEDVAVALAGLVGLAGRGEHAGLREGDLGAAGVVLVVAAHGSEQAQRVVRPPGVEPEHEPSVDLGREGDLVARPAVERRLVRFGRGVVAPGGFLDLPEEKGGSRGEVRVADALDAGAEVDRRRVPPAGTGVELAEREVHPRGPVGVAVGQLEGVPEHEHTLVVAVGRGHRPPEPEARLVGEAAVFRDARRGDRLAELLLGPDEVALVEVGLPDDEQGVVGPLRAGPLAEQLGTLLDGRVEDGRAATGSGPARKQLHEQPPVYRRVVVQKRPLALVELLRCVVVRVVVRPEVVVAAVQGGSGAAPGEHAPGDENGNHGERRTEGSSGTREAHGPGEGVKRNNRSGAVGGWRAAKLPRGGAGSGVEREAPSVRARLTARRTGGVRGHPTPCNRWRRRPVRRPPPPHIPMSLLLAATLAGLAKTLLVALIAVLNAVLALLASLATWKTYLALGTKVALIALFCVPVVGVLAFLFWGQRVVRDRQK